MTTPTVAALGNQQTVLATPAQNGGAIAGQASLAPTAPVNNEAIRNANRALGVQAPEALAPWPNLQRVNWSSLTAAQIYLISDLAYVLVETLGHSDQWPAIMETVLRLPGWESTNHSAIGLGGEWVLRLGEAEIFYQTTKAEVDTDGRDNGRVEQSDHTYTPDNPFKLRVGESPVDVTIYNLRGSGDRLLDPYARDKNGGRPDFVAYEAQAEALRRKADTGGAVPEHFRTVRVETGELVPGSYRDRGIVANIVAKGRRYESMPLGRLGLVLNPRNRVVSGVQVHDAKGKVGRAGEFSYGTIDALNPAGVEGSNRKFSASNSPFSSSRSYGVMLWGGSESVYGAHEGVGQKRYFNVRQTVDDDVDALGVEQGSIQVQRIIRFIVDWLVKVKGIRPSFQLLALRQYARTGTLTPSPEGEQDPLLIDLAL